MIDFFNNLPNPDKTEEKVAFQSKLSTYNISKDEISDLSQMQNRMKLTLPKSLTPESFKIKEPEKPESQRPRRGESKPLF